MKLKELASQFSIAIYTTDIDRGAEIRVHLSHLGFEAAYVDTAQKLTHRLREKPAHLLVFFLDAVAGDLSDFVENALAPNPEVRLIILAKQEQFVALQAYKEYGVIEVLDQDALPEQVGDAVDRACETLYLQFQNEALLEENQRLTTQAESTAKDAERKDQALAQKGPPLEARIKDYLTVDTKEEIVARFLLHMQNHVVLVFKFLPGVRSLLITHASNFDVAKLQGVGCTLTPTEAKDFVAQVAVGFVAPSLKTLLKTAFNIDEARLLPFFVQGKLEGLVALSAALPADFRERVQDEFSLMALAYAHFANEKRLDTVEVRDPLTGVLNRTAYFEKLQEECSRARRLKHPISLLKIALDDFTQLEQTLGEGVRDELIKNLAGLLMKTGRASDTICRTGQNEFSLITPHTPREGAMIKAERLRRLVESTQMLENGLQVSISLGISEYPTLSANPASLDDTATRALAHIAVKGGNSLCLYKAPADHRPDFTIVTESGS